MLKFGIMGCGGIANRFATALAQSEEATLYACAARDPERAATFAAQYGAEKSYGSYQELAADPEVDAIYIATVHSSHAEIARMCIEAGKPLICEKPFFTNGKDAEEIIALAKEKGVLIMEGFWTRIMPAFQKAKEWIRKGRIGDVKLIQAAFCFSVPLNEETRKLRLWNPDLAGGAFLDAGVYPYEFVTGIMDGEPEEKTWKVEFGPTGVDTTVTMSMRYPGGVLANTATSINGYLEPDATVGGTEGYIHFHYFVGSRKVELFNSWGNLVETFEDPVEEGFVHEVNHFAALVRAGKTESDIVPLKDTLAFAKTADAVLKR